MGATAKKLLCVHWARFAELLGIGEGNEDGSEEWYDHTKIFIIGESCERSKTEEYYEASCHGLSEKLAPTVTRLASFKNLIGN